MKPPGPPRADRALGAETETPPVMPAGFFLPFADQSRASKSALGRIFPLFATAGIVHEMTFFSERFGIDAGALEAHGALDVSRCPCGEIFDSHRLENTVIHVPHMTAAQA